MKIPLTFLGTSQAIPTATRNHTSILMQYNEENILIDCGEGTQRQFRKLHLNPCKLTKILITHWHGDHVLGLPGLFQTLALNGYNKTLNIYGPKGTKKYINELFKIFLPVLKIKINIQEVSGKFLDTPNYSITAYPLQHGAPTNGYMFEEKEKLRIDKSKLKKLKIEKKDLKKLTQLTQGKSIKLNNKTISPKQLTYKTETKKISFIFDTKLCPNLNKLAKDSDLAIIEGTYLDEEDLAKEYGHMTITQSAKAAKQNKVKQLILTHISQRYEHKEKILEKTAKAIFKNSIIAHDKMKIIV